VSLSKRGQVATEFMLYTAVFMIIAIGAFLVVNHLQTTEIPLQQNTVAKEIGEGFATTFTLSVKGGEGFSYNYTFPRNIFGRPYKFYFVNLNEDSNIIMEWEGEYGNFSYSYGVPAYNYHVKGCVGDNVFESNKCSNVLMFDNDGETLTISQVDYV